MLLRSFESGVNYWVNRSGDGDGLVAVNGSVFFFGDDGWENRAIFTLEERPALWKTDGTPEGTVLVKENILRLGPASSEEEYDRRVGLARVEDWCAVNSLFFFVVRRDTRDEDENIVEGRSELWRSDGTEAGTYIIKHPEHAGWSPRHLVNVEGILYFSAHDGSHGRELWRSDGSEMNTQLVADINPGPADSDPRHLLNASGTLFFTADNGITGRELWKWQPRGGGGFSGVTEMVKNIQSGPWDLPSFPDYLYYVRNDVNEIMGHLFFTALGRMWISDGTEAGTTELQPGVFLADMKTVASRVYRTWPSVYAELNGSVYYSKFALGTGLELWKSDGIGEFLVKDIWPGGASSNPLGYGRWASEFVKAGEHLYFIASGATGQRVWKTDGTEAGTVPAFPSLGGAERDQLYIDGTFFITTEEGIWAQHSTVKPVTVDLGFSSESFQWTVSGGAGSTYRLETSVNLSQWTEIMRVDATSNIVHLADTNSAPSSQRFYRLLTE